eukprot:29686-Hanusia_phi.AAC.1
MEEMADGIDQRINGPNSWTNQLYAYDLTKEQYDNLQYIHKPTLDAIKDNWYVGGRVSSDTSTFYTLKSIIEKTGINNDDYDDLTWM